jgi:hypothetical protein
MEYGPRFVYHPKQTFSTRSDDGVCLYDTFAAELIYLEPYNHTFFHFASLTAATGCEPSKACNKILKWKTKIYFTIHSDNVIIFCAVKKTMTLVLRIF